MGLAEARECVFPMPAVLRPAMYGLSSTEDGLIELARRTPAGSLNGGGRVVISSLVPPAVQRRYRTEIVANAKRQGEPPGVDPNSLLTGVARALPARERKARMVAAFG
jgi:hypothetical protein